MLPGLSAKQPPRPGEISRAPAGDELVYRFVAHLGLWRGPGAVVEAAAPAAAGD